MNVTDLSNVLPQASMSSLHLRHYQALPLCIIDDMVQTQAHTDHTPCAYLIEDVARSRVLW